MSSSHILPVSGRRVRVGRWLGVVVEACLGITIVVAPAIMAASFEVAELYKQALLVGLVLVALLVWHVKAVVERRAEVVMGWPQVTLLTLGVGALISALLSVDRYVSFVGQFGQRAWAWSSLAALLVLAWLVSQRAQRVQQAANFIFLFLVGGLAVGGVGVWSLVTRQVWNATGSVYALVVSMATVLVVAGGLAFNRERFSGPLMRGCAGLAFALAALILLAVNFWLGWVGVLVGTLVLGVGGWRYRHELANGRWLGLAMVAGACLFLLSVPAFWKVPLPGELAMSQLASWEVAQQTLIERPVFGTGPGTWLYDHALYRPQIVNLSPFWATRFDRGISLYVTWLATTGIVGLLLLGLLIVSVLVASGRQIFWTRAGAHSDGRGPVLVVILAGWMTMVVAAAFYNFNLSQQVFFWTLTGLLLGLSSRRVLVIDMTRPVWSGIVSLKTLVMGVVTLAVLILGGQMVWVEAQAARVITEYQAGSMEVDEAIARLTSLRRVQGRHDVVTRALSQAYLVRIVRTVQGKPVQERARVAAEETAKMVDLALEATRLNPANVENWAHAARAYAQIATFTRGADEFAIKYYREAWRRDPQNPVYPTEMGQVYLFQAQQAQVWLEAKDEKVRAAGGERMREALKQAVALFEKAVVLKADYAPAQYQLAVAFEKQGKTAEAVRALETLVAQEASAERLFELGVLYARLERRAEAMAALERAVAMEANHMKARFQLGVLYEEAGKLREALAQLQVVAASAPENAALRKRVEVLEGRVK